MIDNQIFVSVDLAVEGNTDSSCVTIFEGNTMKYIFSDKECNIKLLIQLLNIIL